MLKLSGIISVLFIMISSSFAAIYYDDWGPVSDRTKEEVGKVISRRFSEANFGEAKKGYIIKSYPVCENKAECLSKFGTIYNLDAPKKEEAICVDAKWFGGHLDCLQSYIDKLYRDVKILEGEQKRLTENSEQYLTYEKLLQEKLRAMEAMSAYQEGLIKKYIRDAVFEGNKLPYEFISFSGNGFDIDLGNGTENTPAPGGATKGEKNQVPRIGLKKGTPCSAASPWFCQPDQLGNGGTGEMQGILMCPVPAGIKKCTPSQGAARDWAKNGEQDESYLQIQEKYCMEQLLQNFGNNDLLLKFRTGQDQTFRNILIDLFFTDSIDNGLFWALYQGLDSARGQKREMIACQYLKSKSPDDTQVQNTIAPMIDKVELEDSKLTPFVQGMSKIIQNDLGRELGLFSIKTKALALLGLSYFLKPEMSRAERVALLVEKFASCDEMPLSSKNSLQSYLEDQAQVLEAEMASSETKVDDLKNFLVPTNAGLILDIDRAAPHFFDDYTFDLERPETFQRKIKSYFDSQLESAKTTCSNGLNEEGMRASTSTSMVANFFKCGDNPPDCRERKRFGWALCGLFESAVQAGKTNDDTDVAIYTALDSRLFSNNKLPLMKELGLKLGLSQKLSEGEEANIHLAMRAMQQFKLGASISVDTLKRIVLLNSSPVSAWIDPGSRVSVGLIDDPLKGPMIYFDVVPAIKIDVAVKTKFVRRIYYKFRDGEFDLSLEGGDRLIEPIKRMIKVKLNSTLREQLPREWQIPGYNPYKDANPDKIIRSALNAFSIHPKSNSSIQSDDFANASAHAEVQTFREHRYNFGSESDQMSMSIPKNAKLQVNLSSNGTISNSTLKELSVSVSPKIKLGDVNSDGTFKEDRYIEISKITFLPGGGIKAEYTIPAEEAFSRTATAGAGLLAFLGVATGHYEVAEKLDGAQAHIRIKQVHDEIDAKLSNKLGPMFREFILKNKDLALGIDLATFMGVE